MVLESLVARAVIPNNFQFAETIIRVGLWCDIRDYIGHRQDMRDEIYLMKWDFVFNERGAASFKNEEGFDKDGNKSSFNVGTIMANWTWHKINFSTMGFKIMQLCAYNIKSWYRDRIEISPGTYMKFSEKKVVNK